MTTTPSTPAEHDPFFQLLTEALRAGPGSAPWGEAVATLRDGGVDGADEYRLILRAREDIELGRDYKKVSAGPGFTRKVLDAVEREGSRRSGIPTATIVAILSALVILGVIITVIVIMSRGGDGTMPDASQAAVERLESATFPVAVASASFHDGKAPSSWQTTGTLPLDFTDGLRANALPKPATAPTTLPAKSLHAGTLLLAEPLPADVAVSLDVEITLPAKTSSLANFSVFVADSKETATGMIGARGEVACLYGGLMGVSANGQLIAWPGAALSGETVKFSIRINANAAIVEVGGRRVYAGPNGLRAGQPRYIGVSFLGNEGNEAFGGVVHSINVSRSANTEPAAGGR